MKKIFFSLIWIFFIINSTFAWDHPFIPKLWLPWDNTTTQTVLDKTWAFFISIFIKFVAVFAVISLMLAWIMYIISGWEEEKTKKAKTWILWSVIWVIFSISAWGIVNMINNIYINN